jgi:cytochrome c biogenesis protein CcmG/thiol:disulfide interchange protein DsbE
MRKALLIPLLLFVALAGFLAVGLTRDPHEVPSPLIGRPAPPFQLPRLALDTAAEASAVNTPTHFSPDDMKGKVWMLNVWASWCVSCREEHPVLLELARSGTVPLIGLDYKDTDADARRWLVQRGDPYGLTAIDADGRVGIDYGVYGVPETYVIDRAGVIRYKQIGPLSDEVLQAKVLPLIRDLEKS